MVLDERCCQQRDACGRTVWTLSATSSACDTAGWGVSLQCRQLGCSQIRCSQGQQLETQSKIKPALCGSVQLCTCADHEGHGGRCRCAPRVGQIVQIDALQQLRQQFSSSVRVSMQWPSGVSQSPSQRQRRSVVQQLCAASAQHLRICEVTAAATGAEQPAGKGRTGSGHRGAPARHGRGRG